MALDLPEHGGDLAWAEARYGPPPGGAWLDFSANVHPDGCPPAVLRAASQALDAVARYPDPASRRATSVLAARLGVPPESVLLTNGGAEALHLALRHLRPRRVGLVEPCFAEYARAARAVDAAVHRWFPDPEVPWDGLAPELLTCEAIVLGRPNNPTGRMPPLVDHPRVVWDEAFIDFVRGVPSLRQMAADGGCIVAGSLTKLYGLAGLRAGYLVAAPREIRGMAALQPTWSVSAIAQAAVEAAAAVEVDLTWLSSAREELSRGLREVGLRPLPAVANFVLAGDAAPDLAARLARRGVLVRNCATFPGLGPNWIRVAVRRPADNGRLIAAISAANRDAAREG